MAKIALLLAPSALPLSRDQVIVGKYRSHAIPSDTGPGGAGAGQCGIWRRSVLSSAQVRFKGEVLRHQKHIEGRFAALSSGWTTMCKNAPF